MGKRKQRTPHHADQAKRQQLQWNMSDQFGLGSSGSFTNDNTLKNDNFNQSSEPSSPASSPATPGGGSSSGTCTPVHALCVDAFYQNLASCHTTLTLCNPDFNKTNATDQRFEFGHFKITLLAHLKLTPLPDQLPEFKECWLYLADGDNPSMLYFETEDNNENVIQQKKNKSRQSKFGVFWFVSLSVPVEVLTSLKNKSFLLLCSRFDTCRKDFMVTIYGNDGVVLKVSHPSEAIRMKMPQVAVQKLMEFYYDIRLPYNYQGRERTTGHDFFHLYECVMSIQLDRLSRDSKWTPEVDSIRHDCLKPKLRPYQKQSVAWMLRQENQEEDNEKDELHPLYCEVKLRDGNQLFYNRHAGSLIRDRPRSIPALPGGILADEMGLGKTVEVLCCMLLHPRLNVELPEPLPVLEEESFTGSYENSRSPSTSEAVDDSSQKAILDADSLVKDGNSRMGVVNTENEGLQSSGQDPNIAQSSNEQVTDAEAAEEVCHSDTIIATESNSMSTDTYPAEQNNPLLSDAGDATKDDAMLSTSEVYSVEIVPPSTYEVVQDEMAFLSSKSTVDLTGDEECHTATVDMATSQPDSGSVSQSSLFADLGPSTSKQQRTSLLSKSPASAGSKVIIKINANNEASVLVEHGSNFQSLPSNDSLISNVNFSSASSGNTDLEAAVVTWANPVLNSSDQLPQSLSSSASLEDHTVSQQGSHQLPSSSALSDVTENSNVLLDQSLSASGSIINNTIQQKRKGKRKSKCFVEYVPFTEEDKNYFSVKSTAQKQYFECNCGQLENEEETRKKGMHTVKCIECGMSQHAECMNYDLSDPFRGEYKCPHCHAVSTTIQSGATLIVSPYSICHQWIEEISKHIKERSIKVFIYTGVSKLGYIQPQTLAQQDIVITTYDVLRKEVDYANLPHTNSESGRRFRHPKRFLATPSPMVAVEWWRICLDEAQMVECVTTKTAEMALKLKAVNRWCVTGTPLMRSVEDIYGLLLFLGVDPLLVQQWFRSLVWEPFCHGFSAPLHHALSQVLWRTAKKDVIDQIDLPVQTEEINWLTFSPVEEHFYRRQYEIYLRNAYAYQRRAQNVQDPNTKLHSLDRKTMNELLSPLFRLRQACCHPQIVRGEFLPLNKSMMTMEELLEHMTKKVKTECEEAHRQIVASLNGMAGLAILRGKLSDAVEKYRDVLRSVEEHKEQFRTDDLQQLHAMHNLAEVLDKKPEGVSPTLRDSSLREQCEELKTKYMARTRCNVFSSHEVLDVTKRAIKLLNEKLATLDGDWWADVVDMTVQRGIDSDLIYKIKDDLVRTSTTEGTIADIFTSADGLMYVIDSHLQVLTKARQTLTSELDRLAKDTTPELVQKAAMCCMRPVGEILKTCPFCKVDELFNEYESKLFLFVERGVTVTGDDSNLAYQVSTKRQGTWADSEVERALKSILAFYRLHFETEHDTLEAASLQLKYMDTLKKEFKNLRSLWLSHREMISAIDELEMATERLRLREKFEPEAATKILNVIEEREMMQHDLKCSSDEIVGRDDLRKKLGQLVYLKNLANKNHEGEGSNPDVCPICQSELGVEWSVLMCGHCYCLRCIRTLIDRSLIGGHLLDRRLKCPMCRQKTPVREISYVTTKKTEKVNVKGSHSTKVQAVIECLIKIKQQDPTAKSLVFSVWVSVLDILAAALAENNIPYRSLHDPNYFQKNLIAFKSEESIQVLLLPLHTGANGLNLVEANNVLLVEPELNLEEEAQAISRIYRIGQTRQTKIHRFLIRGTIEEKIFHMVKSLRDSKAGELEAGESLELTVGHITSLLQQPGPDDEDNDEDNVAVGDGSGGGDDGGGGGGAAATSAGSGSGGDSSSRDGRRGRDEDAARSGPSNINNSQSGTVASESNNDSATVHTMTGMGTLTDEPETSGSAAVNAVVARSEDGGDAQGSSSGVGNVTESTGSGAAIDDSGMYESEGGLINSSGDYSDGSQSGINSSAQGESGIVMTSDMANVVDVNIVADDTFEGSQQQGGGADADVAAGQNIGEISTNATPSVSIGSCDIIEVEELGNLHSDAAVCHHDNSEDQQESGTSVQFVNDAVTNQVGTEECSNTTDDLGSVD